MATLPAATDYTAATNQAGKKAFMTAVRTFISDLLGTNSGDKAAARTALGAATAGAIGSAGVTMATAKLLGRTTGGTGAPEEITVGTGLSLAAGVLSATAVAADQVARDQIALTNLRLMLNSAVTTGALVQGKQWELATDEWGASSTGEEFYSGAIGYYSSPMTGTSITSSSSTGWVLTGAYWSYSGAGAIQRAAAGSTYNLLTYRSAAELAGDFDYSYTQENRAGSGATGSTSEYQFGIGTTAPSGTSNCLYGAATSGMWYMTHLGVGSSRTITFYNNQTSQGTAVVNIAAGDVFKFRRRGSTLTVLQNGVVIFTFSSFSSTAACYAMLGQGGNTNTSTDPTFNNVNWTYSMAVGTGNITLISPSAVSVASAPTYMDAYLLWKDDSGSAALGTDFTVELSRDNGTTYTTATLTNIASFDGTYSVIKARADVSAQPSGTSMLCRIKTLNNKAQRVAAPALYAE